MNCYAQLVLSFSISYFSFEQRVHQLHLMTKDSFNLLNFADNKKKVYLMQFFKDIIFKIVKQNLIQWSLITILQQYSCNNYFSFSYIIKFIQPIKIFSFVINQLKLSSKLFSIHHLFFTKNFSKELESINIIYYCLTEYNIKIWWSSS